MSICTRETPNKPSSFFCRTSLSLLLDTTDMLRSSFFWYRVFFFFVVGFFSNIEIKLKQQISQNTEEKLPFCTHCHTNAKVIYFIILLSWIMILLSKASWQAGGRSSSLGIHKSSCRLKMIKMTTFVKQREIFLKFLASKYQSHYQIYGELSAMFISQICFQYTWSNCNPIFFLFCSTTGISSLLAMFQ